MWQSVHMAYILHIFRVLISTEILPVSSIIVATGISRLFCFSICRCRIVGFSFYVLFRTWFDHLHSNRQGGAERPVGS